MALSTATWKWYAFLFAFLLMDLINLFFEAGLCLDYVLVDMLFSFRERKHLWISVLNVGSFIYHGFCVLALDLVT